MTPRRFDVLSNTAYSALTGFSAILLYIFSIIVARALGPDDYGVFIFALAVGTMLGMVVRFGFFEYLSREMPVRPEATRRLLPAIIGTQLTLAAASAAIILGLTLLIRLPDQHKVVLVLVSAAMLFHSFILTFRGILRGTDRFGADALLMVGDRALLLLAAIAVTIHSWNLVAVAALFLAVRCYDVVFAVAITTPRFGWVGVDIRTRSIKDAMRAAWPFATFVLLFVVYNYTDMIMISFLRNSAEVGFYNVAYQVLEGSHLFPTSLAGALLPVMAINYVSHPEQVNSMLRLAVRVMFAISLPLALFATAYAEPLINLLYGPAYQPASLALQLIIWSTPAFFLAVFARSCFYAARAEADYVRILSISVAFNALLNVPLIMLAGYIGACITTLATELLLLAFLMVRVHGLGFRFDIIRQLWKPLALTLILGVFLTVARSHDLHVLLAAVCSTVLYLSLAAVFRLFTRSDLARLRIGAD